MPVIEDDARKMVFESWQMVLNGDIEQMQQWLATGVDLSQQDQMGRSLLWKAALLGKEEIVIWLLNHGVELNQVDNSGRSAFDVAMARFDPVRVASAIKAAIIADTIYYGQPFNAAELDLSVHSPQGRENRANLLGRLKANLHRHGITETLAIGSYQQSLREFIGDALPDYLLDDMLRMLDSLHHDSAAAMAELGSMLEQELGAHNINLQAALEVREALVALMVFSPQLAVLLNRLKPVILTPQMRVALEQVLERYDSLTETFKQETKNHYQTQEAAAQNLVTAILHHQEEQLLLTRRIEPVETIPQYVPEPEKLQTELFATHEDVEHDRGNEDIRALAKLINEGNERLAGRQEQVIVLMGDTGAGKTTLAHVLVPRNLQALIDDQTGEMILAAIDPLDGMVIGHSKASETTVPNRCLVMDRGIVVWDCPGFNDTSPVQEIANSFYIKKLVGSSAQVKLVLVVDEAAITNNRGINFVRAVKDFMHTINYIEQLAASVSIVVTQVKPHKRPEHLTNSIEQILAANQQVTEPMKQLLTTVTGNASVHLLHRPTEEGKYTLGGDILDLIAERSIYAEIPPQMVNITLSTQGAAIAKQLLYTAHNNMNQLLHIMQQALIDPAQFSSNDNVLTRHYDELVQPWLPGQPLAIYAAEESAGHATLAHIRQLKDLHTLFAGHGQPASIQDGIGLLQAALRTIAQFTAEATTNETLQHYAYVLWQQYEYVRFFTEVSISNGAGEDFQQLESSALANMQTIIDYCCQMLALNMEHQIKTLPLAEQIMAAEYYLEAMEYFAQYPDSKICHQNMAKAHVCLAKLAYEQIESQGQSGADYAVVMGHYIEALRHDKELPDIYSELGILFSRQGDYARAIECYKVLNDPYNVNKCFKAWLETDRLNPEIWLKRGDYNASIGLGQKASKYYSYANGLSQDAEFKELAMHKMAAALRGQEALATKYDILASTHNFYGFDAVGDGFFATLAGEALATPEELGVIGATTEASSI